MSAAPEDPAAKPPVELEDSDEDTLDREAIFARRASLVHRAVRTLGVAVVGAATASCIPCLSPMGMPRDAASDDADAFMYRYDAEVGVDADANPQPCLAPMPPPDADIDAGGGNG